MICNTLYKTNINLFQALPADLNHWHFVWVHYSYYDKNSDLLKQLIDLRFFILTEGDFVFFADPRRFCAEEIFFKFDGIARFYLKV